MEEIDVLVYLNLIQHKVRMPAYQYAALNPGDYITGVIDSPYAYVVGKKAVTVNHREGLAVLFISENTDLESLKS